MKALETRMLYRRIISAGFHFISYAIKYFDVVDIFAAGEVCWRNQ